MGLCVLIHIFNAGTINEYEDKLFDIYSEIYEYYTAHPYLELDKELKQTFLITEEMEEYLKTMTTDKYSAGPTEEQIEEMQAYLDNLVEELNFTKESLPWYKWGLVPKDKTFVGLIGHMFLHAGWIHLLFNLIYLYIMGPFIEDSWGKPAYAVFYLGTGILAALAFAAHYPNSGVPMIGASGAIAGVMGGFLIRHWHARIRYFYMFTILIRGTFTAPAWVMLPIGFIMELINASIMDSIAPEGGGGVAHWAHVWGFIFGAAGALLIKFLKIEEKFVAPKVEAETSYVNKSFVTYEEAMQALADGDKEKAYAMLMDASKEGPSNQDVIGALWNIAPEMGRTGEVAPLLTRLIEKEVQQARLEAALFHYKHLRSKVPDTRFSTHTKIMIFEQSVNVKDLEEAKILYGELLNEVNLASSPGLVLELCIAALKFDLNFGKSLANKVIELALQHPEVPEDRKESLKQKLYAIQEPKIPITPSQSQPPPIPIEPIIPIKPNQPTIPIKPGEPVTSVRPEPMAEDRFAPPPPPGPRKSFRVTKAVPIGVKGGKIALNIENMGQRFFALEKVKAISVVKISPPGERPFLLIDLFVDDPGAPTAATAQEVVIRTLRLLSPNFNPQKFVAQAQGPLEAFKIFTCTCHLHLQPERNNSPIPNATKLSILSNPNAGSRATHPASSKLLKNVEEAPLSRGEFQNERNSEY
jgi:membrane associated rhomboid family serine protease